MTSQLALCISTLIFAAAFLVSAIASLFLANHRSSTRSRNSSSSPHQSSTKPEIRSLSSHKLPTSSGNSTSPANNQSSTSLENSSSPPHKSPTRSASSSPSPHQLSTIPGNGNSSSGSTDYQLSTRSASSTSPQINRSSTSSGNGNSSSGSTAGQVDPEANNPKSWGKGDIVKDTTSEGVEEYTILNLFGFQIIFVYASDSEGSVHYLPSTNLKRIDKSKYEDKNYEFQKGDEVELLAKFLEIEKGAKGTVTGIQSEGFCEVEFSDGKEIRMNTLYLGKLKQKY